MIVINVNRRFVCSIANGKVVDRVDDINTSAVMGAYLTTGKRFYQVRGDASILNLVALGLRTDGECVFVECVVM